MTGSRRYLRIVQVAYPQIYFACHTSPRVKTMLSKLKTADRRRALEGLALLARGARLAQGDRP